MEPEYVNFGPDGTAQNGQLVMSVDEYEVIRLVDLEEKTHGECAKQMDISRTTVIVWRYPEAAILYVRAMPEPVVEPPAD